MIERQVSLQKRRRTDSALSPGANRILKRTQSMARGVLEKKFVDLPEAEKKRLTAIATSPHMSEFERLKAWTAALTDALESAKSKEARAVLLTAIERCYQDLNSAKRGHYSRRKNP